MNVSKFIDVFYNVFSIFFLNVLTLLKRSIDNKKIKIMIIIIIVIIIIIIIIIIKIVIIIIIIMIIVIIIMIMIMIIEMMMMMMIVIINARRKLLLGLSLGSGCNKKPVVRIFCKLKRELALHRRPNSNSSYSPEQKGVS